MRDSRIRQKGESGRSDKRFVSFGDLLAAAALVVDRRLYREYDRHEDECRDWIYGPDGNLTRDSPVASVVGFDIILP